MSRQSLRILGIWPDPLVPLNDFHRPNIRFIIIACILCLYVIVPQITNVILAWGNVIRVVEQVASANFSLLALCKLISTWYHGEPLRMLMTSVMSDWMTKDSRERNTMLILARRGRRLSMRCYAVMIFALMLYITLNFFFKFYRSIHQTQRYLVYRFTYPYNTQKSPNYEITFFIQLSGGLYTALINTSIDSFISILLLHICAQLINLRTALNNLVDELAEGSISSSRFKEGLAAITVRHEHLIRNAKIVNDSYSAVLFVHMIAVTFQLCFESIQLFMIVTNHVDVSIIKIGFLMLYIAVVLTQLYMYCYSAERLITESTSMTYGVYECKWYDISAKDAKNLMFMACRSSTPLRLTAGKFGIFSLEMFGKAYSDESDKTRTVNTLLTLWEKSIRLSNPLWGPRLLIKYLDCYISK